MTDKEQKHGLQIGNIGSVGGDIVGGNKVTANGSSATGGDGSSQQEISDTPRHVQTILAWAGLITAIVAGLAAIAEWL